MEKQIDQYNAFNSLCRAEHLLFIKVIIKADKFYLILFIISNKKKFRAKSINLLNKYISKWLELRTI